MRVKRVAVAKGHKEHDEKEDVQPTSEKEEMEFIKLFMTLNADERALIGHNFTTLVKACTFRGRSCENET